MHDETRFPRVSRGTPLRQDSCLAFGVLDPAAPEGGQAKRSELARTGGAAGAAAPDGVSGSRIPDRQAEGQKDLS